MRHEYSEEWIDNEMTYAKNFEDFRMLVNRDQYIAVLSEMLRLRKFVTQFTTLESILKLLPTVNNGKDDVIDVRSLMKLADDTLNGREN